jgi:hypothetical protein
VAVVEALNTIGYSAASAENTVGALAQTVPDAPPAAPERGSGTDRTQLEVHYAPYSQDGGAAILSYGLEIDRGDGSGFVEEVDALLNSYVISSGIDSGASYSVRYRARNVLGWAAAYSPELVIIAASVPTEPTDVETANTAAPATTAVRVSWAAPADLGGAGIAVTAYRILVRHAAGVTFS